MKTKRSVGLTLVMGLGVALAACGDDAVEMLGDAMVSVGDAFRDGGDVLRDAESVADAQAPGVMAMVGSCEPQTFERTVTDDADGSVVGSSTQTIWVAEFTVPGLDRTTTHLSASLCGYTSSLPTGERCPEAPAGFTAACTGEPYNHQKDCQGYVPQSEGDTVYVQCGARTVTVNADGEESMVQDTLRPDVTLFVW